LSVVIQFANAIYAYARLNGAGQKNTKTKIAQKTKVLHRYKKVFKIIKTDHSFLLILFAIFSSLI